jgi:N-acetylmuramoyl-L-alanine amidase
MIRKLLSILLFSCFIESNEVVFHEVNEVGNDTVEISFFLNSVSFIKSYSLENPSRIVMDLYDTELNSVIEESYNYPIKKIRATPQENNTRIVIDLYEYVYWVKPTQVKTDEGVLLKLQISRNKKLLLSMQVMAVNIQVQLDQIIF